MLCEAAAPWDLKLHILDRDYSYPAAPHAPYFHEGDFRMQTDVLAFGRQMDILTIEIEGINLEAYRTLASEGLEVHPNPKALEVIGDKQLQAEFYQKNGFPVAPFNAYAGKNEIMEAIENGQLSYPFVQKSRKDGYDGRGVAIVSDNGDNGKIMDTGSICQEKIEIEKELAVVVARNKRDQIETYDPVEMVFHPEANLLEYLVSPARISMDVIDKLKKIASELISAFNISGLLTVEFFLDSEGKIWVNEVAPRPHNSGHHTIDSAVTSQYEQHLRAILNLPLGNTALRMPALLFNLLGEPGHNGPVKIEGIDRLLNTPDAHFHWYGKKETRPYRKMGHVTLCGNSVDSLIETAGKIQTQIKIVT